ncbi:MAG: glycine-rich domain-containing protein [Bacteroidota bacterium]
MIRTHQDLWARIKKFEIADPQAEFPFLDRLARENSWTHEYSARAILEYKRFMFLICISEHPLTPSDQVDQVWHLHLIYSESYWKDFCRDTLRKAVQHGPTKGGEKEKAKYNNWYEATKDLYRNNFELEPPKDIWPPSEIRFGQIRFTRVNLHTNWVIPKPKFLTRWKS